MIFLHQVARSDPNYPYGKLCVGPYNSVQKYQFQPGKTLYDPKNCIDSKSAIRFRVVQRNLELPSKSGNLGWRTNPGRPDRTETRFGFPIKFGPRKPKLGPRALTCTELDRQTQNDPFWTCFSSRGPFLDFFPPSIT